MNENTKFESVRKSIISGFCEDEDTGLTPLEFLDTFEDVNKFTLKSVLPLTYNAIRRELEENSYHELSKDYFSTFCVVRLSNDRDYGDEVCCMYQPNLKYALAIYTAEVAEIENGKGYHCSLWQIKLEKEKFERNGRIYNKVLHELSDLDSEMIKELESETKVLTESITIECVGEHSNWKPIVDSLAKVKKLNVGDILKGYDMYLASQV